MILSYDQERSRDVLYDDDDGDDDCCHGNGDDGTYQSGNDVDSGDVLMSCSVDYPYCCCYGDGDHDGDGGDDDDDALWMMRNDVCVLMSYCDLVMWNVHVSEIYLCDVSGGFLSC